MNIKSIGKTTIVSIVAISFALVVMGIVSNVDFLELVEEWRQYYGVTGVVVFSVVGGISVVFCFPGSILMTTAGAAFGLEWGFVAGLACVLLGAILAFFVSRYFARQRIEKWVLSNPKFAALDEAIGEGGWQLVVLTRCCPIFPFIFQNYAYGLTQIQFLNYAAGSFVGLLPANLLFVYMGSLGRTGVEVFTGGTSVLELAFSVLGFTASVAMIVYITKLSTRALKRAGL